MEKTTYRVTTIRARRFTSFAGPADPFPMPVAQTQEIRLGLTELEPESRALLELSTRRRVPDADLAQLLGIDTDEVGRRRQEAVEVLAVQLRLGTQEDLFELEAALRGDEAWQPPHPNGNAAESELNGLSEPGTVALSADEAEIPGLALEQEPEADEPTALEEPEPEAEEPSALEEPETEDPEPESADPKAESERRRSRALTLTAAGLLLVVAGGAVVALTSGGDYGDKSSKKQASSFPPARPLQALPGGKAKGTASLDRGRLGLQVSGLTSARRGFYEVWLYNSVGDARSIGRLRKGRLNVKLPSGASRYRLVDVSREPRDGNPNHSGASVVRVPLSDLER